MKLKYYITHKAYKYILQYLYKHIGDRLRDNEKQSIINLKKAQQTLKNS